MTMQNHHDTTPPATGLDVADRALVSARRIRAQVLLDVHSGLLTLWDVFAEAATAEGRPLLKLRLRQLLMAQEGWGVERSEKVVRLTCELVGRELTTRKELLDLRLGWVLDSRTGGNRFAALVDAVEIEATSRRPAPWNGFPYAPEPEGLLDIKGVV